jgi:acyl carrier protein
MLNKFRQQIVSSAFRSNQIMAVQAQRTYLSELGLDSNSIAVRDSAEKKSASLELWKAQVDNNKGLVLKTNDEIEAYVLSVVKDYFRTTKKASLTLDSAFADHGLDSLDAIEFVIRIEDELGYLIDAENLELFKKPRHFVNFIKQLEAYKTEFNKLPHEGNKYHFHFEEAFPGLPKMGH